MHPDHHHKPQSKEVINITENIVIIEGQHYHKGNPELKIITELVQANQALARIIEKLIKNEHPHTKAKALTANYMITTNTGDIKIISSIKKIIPMAQTITVLAGQNTVPGQLVPVAADNVTVEPISTINAGSEVYTSSDPSIATVVADPSGVEGAFIVTRVPGAVGSIQLTYTATTPEGSTITNVGGVPDTIIFQGQPTNVAAALTATFGTPS